MPCASLRVVVEDSARGRYPDAIATLSGRPVPVDPAGPVDVEPGLHELVVDAPAGTGLAQQRRRLTLEPGTHRTVLVILAPHGQEGYLDEHGGLVPVAFGDPHEVVISLRGRCPDAADLLDGLVTSVDGDRCEAVSELRVRLREPTGTDPDPVAAVMERLAPCAPDAVAGLPVVVGGAGTDAVLTNDAIVRLRRPAGAEDVAGIVGPGFTAVRPLGPDGDVWVVRRRAPLDPGALGDVMALSSNPAVVTSEPDLLFRRIADAPDLTGQVSGLAHLTVARCPEAWRRLARTDPSRRGGARDITIAVIDDGVDPSHPDLRTPPDRSGTKLVASVMVVGGRAAPLSPKAVRAEHGTWCAGSAAGSGLRDDGVLGVAPNCGLIGVGLYEYTSFSEVIDALDWAAGLRRLPGWGGKLTPAADVISCSWGFTGLQITPEVSACLNRVTTRGRGGRGCVLVFSVGNLGDVRFSELRTFAAHPATVAVGASVTLVPQGHVPPTDAHAPYSPFGEELDIVAPSSPTSGAGAAAYGIRGALPGAFGQGLANRGFGGTSHAAPMVAGAAALILSMRPDLQAREVRRILRASARVVDPDHTGRGGRWRRGAAPFSPYFGAGRLDVARAVGLAERWRAGQDPAQAPDGLHDLEDARTLCGVVAPAGPGRLRIYAGTTMTDFVEVAEDAVLHSAPLPDGGRTVVWIEDAARARGVTGRRSRSG